MINKAKLPLAIILAMVAAACSRTATGDVATASDGVGGSNVHLAADGLTTGSRGLHHSTLISFGDTRNDVLARLRPALGAPTAGGRNAECPTGAVDFVKFGTLNLNFENNRFVGWVVDGASEPAIETYQGLQFGMARSEVDADAEAEAEAQPGSTLGNEWVIDGVGALFDGDGPDARVKTLFSGVTCFAR